MTICATIAAMDTAETIAFCDEIAEYENANDVDIIVYNGPIREVAANVLRKKVASRTKRRKNALLVLCTYGGAPSEAFKIARTLQRKYEKFSIFVPGECKSAGTLIAIGATEIIMTELGELGPLDMQLRKGDELWEKSSGLNVASALQQIESRVGNCFNTYFLNISSAFQFSTATASEIASTLTQGIYKGIAEQIDPIQLGETNRSIRIAQHYGESLNNKSKNLQEDALMKLVAGYPSHDYVIDIEESRTLFKHVREPGNERELFSKIVDSGNLTVVRGDEKESVIMYIHERLSEHLNKQGAKPNESSNVQKQPANSSDAQSGEQESRRLSDQVESDVLPDTEADTARDKVPGAPASGKAAAREQPKR